MSTLYTRIEKLLQETHVHASNRMSLKTTFAVYPKEPTKGGRHIGIFGKVGEGRVWLHVGRVFFINASSKLVTKLIQHSN